MQAPLIRVPPKPQGPPPQTLDEDAVTPSIVILTGVARQPPSQLSMFSKSSTCTVELCTMHGLVASYQDCLFISAGCHSVFLAVQ